jgi:hypothetical protein
MSASSDQANIWRADLQNGWKITLLDSQRLQDERSKGRNLAKLGEIT